MSSSGESVRRLTDFGFSPSWSPDGASIVVSLSGFSSPTVINLSESAHGLSIVDVKSGQTRRLGEGPGTMQPAWQQPAWSPSGWRIAFFSVRSQSGQRDIWTVAADGSDAAGGGVPVTDDSALDWNPTWSPDGRYLYFSSTRGGTMNVWRTPIDERSGRVLGPPEPTTTPATWAGGLSFSRDGTQLAYASLDYRSTILRVPFDRRLEAVTGPTEAILKGTRPIRDHELSPDGEWIAFTEAGVREDLFVARARGTEYRRLTDDGFRDRGPAWSPDGSRVAFYSDRSGAYDLWMARPDGSGLTPVTSGLGTPGFPVWSPDATAIAFGYQRWHIVNPAVPSQTGPPAMPAIGPNEDYFPTSWSPTGDRLAGQIRSADGWTMSVGVYSVATKQFTRVPGDLVRTHQWVYPLWLTDSRRLLVRRPDGIVLVDAETGAGRMLITVAGDMIGHTVGVSRDNRWITYTETATEGDIWIGTIARTNAK